MGLRSTYRRCLFTWSLFWSWRICKQAKLSYLTPIKPVHWNADVPKTSHCLVRILVQRHNWAIFLRRWLRRGRYSQWRSLSGRGERIFIPEYWRWRYWQHLVSTGRRYVPHSLSYTQCFASWFWRSHYQPQNWWGLATSELWFNTVGLLFVGCRFFFDKLYIITDVFIAPIIFWMNFMPS